MSFDWIEPRKRFGSLEPRIKITEKFISMNTACCETYLKEIEYAKIGYDEKEKKLIFVPVAKEDKTGMKIISNLNSRQKYINASKLFKKYIIGDDSKGEYKCTWDTINKGVLINLISDKVK